MSDKIQAIENRTIQRNNCIDLMKFVMAVAVVAIHTSPLKNCNSEWFNRAYIAFVSLAVPFFFVTTGYLLGTKMKYAHTEFETLNILEKYLKKIIKMYIIWTIIYFPLVIYHYSLMEKSILYCAALYVRGLFLIGSHRHSWVLWYLLSLIYALLALIYLLRKKCTLKNVYIFSGCIWCISILINGLVEYEGEFFTILNTARNLIKYTIENARIFSGMIYVPIGIFLAEKSFKVNVGMGIFLVSYFVNIFTDNKYDVVTIICVIGLFIIISNIKLLNSRVYYILGKMSTHIYFIHLYVWFFLYMLIYGKEMGGISIFLLTLGVSVLCSLLYQLILYRRVKCKKLFGHEDIENHRKLSGYE